MWELRLRHEFSRKRPPRRSGPLFQGKGKRGTRKRGGKADITVTLSLSIEEDRDADPPRLLRLPPGVEPSFVIETSHSPAQNRHFHFLYDRLVTVEEAEELQELAFRKCGGDPDSNKDISHMWRVPGCWNHPNPTSPIRPIVTS